MAKKVIDRNPVASKIADLILENYKIGSAQDINGALKEVFGPLFENEKQYIKILSKNYKDLR